MIDAIIKNGQFAIKVKLIGLNKIIKEEKFFLDTGFDDFLKIDKKLFDELGLKKEGSKNVSVANMITDVADLSEIKFEVDEMIGEVPIMALGWGGRNLMGMKFLDRANILLVMDGSKGVFITNNRTTASEVGKLIQTFTIQQKERLIKSRKIN